MHLHALLYLPHLIPQTLQRFQIIVYEPVKNNNGMYLYLYFYIS